ncbi:MAG: arginine--tRNA ligase, partial [Candidatus Zambryskibacteria bacterium]|nr:arginine--tRNA ligase [Candidatus Zambryskibacteria bacterium]
MKETLKSEIEAILKDSGIENPRVSFDIPTHTKLGDSTTNVAMAYAKELQKKPVDLALEIKEALIAKSINHISRIDVIAPGFINFFFDEHYFNKNLQRVLNDENFGKNKNLSGKKVLVEHSSPNLFKAFHIGHVMNNAIGESISRLAKFSGGDVTVISYPSDVSLGIAKAVWALMDDGGLEKLKQISVSSEAISYLGECYVKGTKSYEDEVELQPRIREIASLIYKKEESEEYRTYLEAKELNLSYFKNITETLGSKFDGYIYESEAGVIGEKLVLENLGKVFVESEGAIIYEGENDGLHTRVFINKEGHPTYEAKDLGLLAIKFSRYNPDLSLFVTDHEQTEYFKVVAAAASRINPVWKERTLHKTHGRMSFKGEKMSSRLGGIPSAQELLDFLYEELRGRSAEISSEDIQIIAVAALKFSILRSMAGKNIDFDPATSLSSEGDSGPYLQYATVRANSLLKKAEGIIDLVTALPSGWETANLERYLERFESVVLRA